MIKKAATVIGGTALALSGAINAGVGHAATAAKSTCALAEVTVHGTGAPSTRCLSASGAGLTPQAGTDTGCPTSDLVRYWNGPIGVSPNYTLCVNGTGLLNLNQNFYGRNWNDQASAWWTGCRDVYFYTDINQGGGSAFEYGSYYGQTSPQGIFPDQGVGNDKLSSVYLASSHGCPAGN
jgi:hypothetical protein